MAANESMDQVAAMIAALAPDDAARQRAILAAGDQATVAKLIREYYRDLDRANRTPRGLLYLHVGMLCGDARVTEESC
jgi:hypothetical protein